MGESETENHSGARRPIKARESRWAAAYAAWLAKRGVSPNAISVGSVGCALFAGAALVGIHFTQNHVLMTLLFLLAILGIQGRLICNLLDGMVAIEGAKASKSGELFNDLPDRIADPIILVAAGFAVNAIGLGWTAALLAVMTAYVRVLGRSIGSQVYFTGPMAKQHRMAVLTAACLIGAVLSWWDLQRQVLDAALAVIILGCIWTIIRRMRLIIRDLEIR